MSARPDQSLYPVRYEIDDLVRQRRWTVFLRLPLSLPVLVFSVLIQGGLALAIWAAILVSGRIPGWLFEFQVSVNRWHVRAASYLLLITDHYPPFEGDHPVQYTVESVSDVRSRWKVLIWKIISAIPLGFIAVLLTLTFVIVVPIMWFVAMATGQVPRHLQLYVAGGLRWIARLQAYVLSLTDDYPPFRFAPESGAARSGTYLLSSAAGLLMTIVFGTAIGFVVAFGGQHIESDVPYQALLAGEFQSEGVRGEVHVARVWLTGAIDPVESLEPYFVAEEGTRMIAFDLRIDQRPSSTESVPISGASYSLQSDTGAKYKPILVTIDGQKTSVKLGRGMSAHVHVIFQLPVTEAPVDFRFDLLNYIDMPRVGETIVYHLM